jgi:hypothetical protein
MRRTTAPDLFESEPIEVYATLVMGLTSAPQTVDETTTAILKFAGGVSRSLGARAALTCWAGLIAAGWGFSLRGGESAPHNRHNHPLER